MMIFDYNTQSATKRNHRYVAEQFVYCGQKGHFLIRKLYSEAGPQ